MGTICGEWTSPGGRRGLVPEATTWQAGGLSGVRVGAQWRKTLLVQGQVPLRHIRLLQESLGSGKPFSQLERGLQKFFCGCAEKVRHSQPPEGSGLAAARIQPLLLSSDSDLRAELSQVCAL